MPVLVENHTAFAIGDAVNHQLEKSCVSGVNCQCTGSLVVLRGAVPSAQIKQQAITIARAECGMREIANEIEVVCQTS
jgi:osmotically-inducible protein OsmY